MSILIKNNEPYKNEYSNCDLEPVSKWSPDYLDFALKKLESQEILSAEEFELMESIEKEISNRKEITFSVLSDNQNISEKSVSLVNFMEQLHEESLRLEKIISNFL